MDVGQRLCVARNKAVCFRKDLIFDTNRRNISLLELLDQSAEIIEAAITGITVKHDWHTGGVRHELQCFQYLRPRGLIVVAHTVLRRNCQTAAPDALEARLLNDFGAQSVVRLTNKFKLSRC